MQKCEHCKVMIRTRHETCPLCHRPLSGNQDTCEEIFPVLLSRTSVLKKIIRYMTFICLVIAILCTSINFMFPGQVHWAVYVDCILFFLWIICRIGIMKRKNLLKIILWESSLLIAAATIFDLYIGRAYITLDYIYPGVCIVALVLTLVCIYTQKLTEKDFMIYLLMINIASIVLCIFMFFNLIEFKILSVVCVVLNLSVLMALLIFKTESVKNEVSKKFHF